MRGTIQLASSNFAVGEELFFGDDPFPVRVTAVNIETCTLTIGPLSFWRELLYALIVMLD